METIRIIGIILSYRNPLNRLPRARVKAPNSQQERLRSSHNTVEVVSFPFPGTVFKGGFIKGLL